MSVFKKVSLSDFENVNVCVQTNGSFFDFRDLRLVVCGTNCCCVWGSEPGFLQKEVCRSSKQCICLLLPTNDICAFKQTNQTCVFKNKSLKLSKQVSVRSSTEKVSVPYQNNSRYVA